MVNPEINSSNPEQSSSEISPLQLALNGTRAQFQGFVNDDQRELAKLLDKYTALDHSLEVISIDAQVRLNNRRPSPAPSDNVVYRTPEERKELEEIETPKATDSPKEAEIRMRKATIRKVFDQANGKGYEEAKAHVETVQNKHKTTHRPTTRLEKSASERHNAILNGSYHRKDFMTKRLASFQVAHGEDTDLHKDDKRNFKKQERSVRRLTHSVNAVEDEVLRSMRGQGPEQFRIRMKQGRIAKKIARLSREVRIKGLWIDDLFELRPEPPVVEVEEEYIQQPEAYNPRSYLAMTMEDHDVARGELIKKQSLTEQAFSTLLETLSKPSKKKAAAKTVDADFVTDALKTIDKSTPALAKFTLQRLQREGIVDNSGKVLLDKDTIRSLVGETAVQSRNAPIETLRERLTGLKNETDKLFAFALGHIGGFYSVKNDHVSLPRLSRESLASVVERAFGNEVSDEIINSTYDRLVDQGILALDGSVIQSKETIRGALGSLYGDDTPDKKEKKKKPQRNQRRPRQ